LADHTHDKGMMRAASPVSLLLALLACGPEDPEVARRRIIAGTDSGFAGVQARGEVAMGVNQYTSRHVFEPLPDGGRIELQRSATDSAGTARIRRHMEQIARQFAAGDFQLPGFVHAERVPGTSVMAARRGRIQYSVEMLPRGAALRVRSQDSAAVRAIHEFLAFQRKDHHAAAHRDS
jgi:hypothetical protein